MEDLENVLMELSALEKNPQTTAISRCLDEYLTHVAKTGNALFAWNKVKPLFKRKLEMIIQDFQETSPTDSLPRQPNVEVFKFDQMKERVFEQLESYTGIPFTVQRLCELMVQPKKHYKRTDKFMRGLEKVMLVVSTVDPNPVPGEPEAECEAGASSLETESPSKRMRLSSAQDTEAGPCDSADEAGLSVAGAAVAVEVVPDLDTDAVAGPSRQLGEGGGLERGDTEAEAGEESMDIDTECTSSQGRLALTANTSDDSLDTGVESSAAAAQASEASSDSDGMDIESPGRGAESGTGVASSSGAGAGAGQPGCREAEEAGLEADTGVSTSLATQHTQHTQEAGPEDTGAASSSGDTSTSSSAAHEDTAGDSAAAPDNSEAEPSEATASLEAAVEESEAGTSAEDAVAGEQCSEVASASVQSSDSEAPAPRADPGDSGAADSSDQASVAGPGQDLGTSDQGSISTSEAAGAADTEESGDSPDQSDTAVV